MSSEIVDFLNNCYDRAEQKAQAAGTDGEQSFVDASPAIEPLLFNADGEFDLHKRMLADIARKRAILAECEADLRERGGGALQGDVDRATWRVLALLAEEFAHEPGYDESWRP